MIARRVGMELAHLHPEPPAVRVFDAGMGDGTLLTRVLRDMHRRFPTLPFYVVGKEISLEDTRLSLDKMADRFHEHPATVLVVTNMYYTEAPWLAPNAVSAATSLAWHEVALTGSTAAEFSEQIAALEPLLARVWQARHSPKTGNPVYERPAAIVIYRDDFRFLLDDVIPRQGRARADYDLVIASQPYRARVPGRLQGLARGQPTGAGAATGRTSARHPLLRPRSRPRDHPQDLAGGGPVPDQPARHPARHACRARPRCAPLQLQCLCRSACGVSLRHAHPALGNCRQHRHLDAVCGLERRRLRGPDRRRAAGASRWVTRKYLDATREVLQAHGRLWFLDESYVISRKRG